MARTQQHLKVGDALWSMDRCVGIITGLDEKNVSVAWFVKGQQIERFISYENALDLHARYVNLKKWVEKGKWKI